MNGSCQCGAVTFRTPTATPSVIYVCHCNQCRHQSSSSYGLTAIFPAFTISSPYPGALGVYTRHTLSNRKLDCYFCAKCGSRLMHKTEGEAELSVKAGCLEGLDLRGERGRKAVHIWTKEAVVDIPEGVERYEEEPPGGSLQGEVGALTKNGQIAAGSAT